MGRPGPELLLGFLEITALLPGFAEIWDKVSHSLKATECCEAACERTLATSVIGVSRFACHSTTHTSLYPSTIPGAQGAARIPRRVALIHAAPTAHSRAHHAQPANNSPICSPAVALPAQNVRIIIPEADADGEAAFRAAIPVADGAVSPAAKSPRQQDRRIANQTARAS